MKRIHLFEFTDLSWYPDLFRRFQTDYLQFVASLGSGHRYLIPLFKRAMQSTHTNEIVDLCSGGTGPWMHLTEQLEQAGLPVNITLTDKYPNPDSVQKRSATSRQHIKYLTRPVDAMNVPESLKGMRTLFEGFHHFKPSQAKLILQDAINKRSAIGIFEATLKPPLGIILLLLSPLITTASYFFMTPFIKPRTFARFFWTYLIPVVPLATSWDGVVSLLRTYSPKELKELTDSCISNDYTWEVGYASTGTPVFSFTYLVGYPNPDKPEKIYREAATPQPRRTIGAGECGASERKVFLKFSWRPSRLRGEKSLLFARPDRWTGCKNPTSKVLKPSNVLLGAGAGLL